MVKNNLIKVVVCSFYVVKKSLIKVTVSSFYVVDSKSAASPIREVFVLFCTGCSRNGQCDFTRSRPTTDSTSFQFAVCNCNTGWTGDDCGENFNACLENPCILGQNCTDLSPAEHSRRGVGYNCSNCPMGYAVNNISKCEDVNECTDNTSGCVQTCTNTDGSYMCSCRAGYRLNANRHFCDDINECIEKTHHCQQVCINTDGGYNCSCEAGYSLGINGSCIQIESANATCHTAGCSQGCKVLNNTAECFCLAGYTRSNKTVCTDVDECRLSVCSQVCNNTPGSYFCSCRNGYQLDSDETTCVPCPNLRYGPGCQLTCQCNGRGTNCNSLTGCECQEGWKGTNCQEDVNECVVTPGICGSSLQICTNTNGSYRCDCLPGYIKTSTGSCQGK